MLKTINPATGKEIIAIKKDSSISINEKQISAKVAQKKWATTPLSERIKIIQVFAEKLAEKKEKLAEILTLSLIHI